MKRTKYILTGIAMASLLLFAANNDVYASEAMATVEESSGSGAMVTDSKPETEQEQQPEKTEEQKPEETVAEAQTTTEQTVTEEKPSSDTAQQPETTTEQTKTEQTPADTKKETKTNTDSSTASQDTAAPEVAEPAVIEMAEPVQISETAEDIQSGSDAMIENDDADIDGDFTEVGDRDAELEEHSSNGFWIALICIFVVGALAIGGLILLYPTYLQKKNRRR